MRNQKDNEFMKPIDEKEMFFINVFKKEVKNETSK